MDTTTNSQTSSSSPTLHVVMCPWLTFGHMLPYLNLAERLASRGHGVTFVSIPGNIARLPPVHPTAAVSFVALPLPHVDGLPDGAESTHDVPHDKMELLWKAFDRLAVPFAEFFSSACAAATDERPDCVIFDVFHYWAATTAREHKVPGVMFQLSSAYSVAVSDRWWLEHAARKATEAADKQQPAMSVDQRRFMILELCTFTAVNSCQEWEAELIPFVETLGGKPVVLLGLMPPPTDQGRRRRVVNGKIEDDNVTLCWLDTQPVNSVVYMALGSEATLRVEQVDELALGLELAGTRFLWALRKPRGGNSIPGDEDVLPPGFLERTHGRGLVSFGWVPQTCILAHGAVGAFLTHCGWGSTIEGPLFGHPLVRLHIAWDQWSNAQLLEGKKVGVQVPRDDKDRTAFTREGVASAVRIVMTDVESRMVFVQNARKLQDIVSNRELQERYIDGFIQQLMSSKENSRRDTSADRHEQYMLTYDVV